MTIPAPLKGRTGNPYSIPSVIDPGKTRCIQVIIPDSLEYLQIFYAALLTLTKWKNWELDGTTSASQCATLWRNLLISQNFPPCDQAAAAGADEGVENLIRQNPDNPCLLETSINGTDWCPFADLSLCINLQGQIGVGAEQPRPGGGCVTYHIYMPANSLYLLPTNVSTGDTITITHPSGAANDGGETVWRTPTGGQFVAGLDIGGYAYNAGDPQPTTPHMALILQIGATYYSFTAFAFTVPGGVANQPVTLQVNDSAISNDYGGFNLDVEVCNNQAATWSRDYLFSTGTHGWILLNNAVGNTKGAYTGSAFIGTCDLQYPADPTYYNECQIQLSFPSTTLTVVQASVDTTKGTVIGAYNPNYCNYSANNGAVSLSANDGLSDGAHNIPWMGSQVATSVEVLIGMAQASDCTDPGSGAILSVHLEGTGTPPP